MKILWVTAQLPSLRAGGQVRQYYLLRGIAGQHQVRLVSLVRDDEVEDARVLESWGVQIFPAGFKASLQTGGLKNQLSSWMRLLFNPRPEFARTYPLHGVEDQMWAALSGWQPDVACMDQLFTVPLTGGLGKTPWVLSQQNIESLNCRSQWRQMGRWTRKAAGYLEEKKLERWEKAWVQRSDACIVVSDDDAAVTRQWAPGMPVYVVPNGVDVKRFLSHGETGTRVGLIFYGVLGYAPNTDALLYFSRDILPLVKETSPHTTLTILGANAPMAITDLGTAPGIQYLGFVPDVRPYLWTHKICVVPLRSGGGTRLKILESMAAGLPVVSTTKGAEGLEVQHMENILIADTPREFVEAVELLENNDVLYRKIQQNGQALVKRKYDWSELGRTFEHALLDLRGKSISCE